MTDDDKAPDGFSWGKKGDAEAQAILDAQSQTQQDRLAAALDQMPDSEYLFPHQQADGICRIDPTIAADMELGRRIRESTPYLVSLTVHYDSVGQPVWRARSDKQSGEGFNALDALGVLRAALTEGEK